MMPQRMVFISTQSKIYSCLESGLVRPATGAQVPFLNRPLGSTFRRSVTSFAKELNSLFPGNLAIHHAPNADPILVSQFNRQCFLRKVLKTNRTCEALDRVDAYRCRPHVSGCRIRSTVMHRCANLNTCGEAIKD